MVDCFCNYLGRSHFGQKIACFFASTAKRTRRETADLNSYLIFGICDPNYTKKMPLFNRPVVLPKNKRQAMKAHRLPLY